MENDKVSISILVKDFSQMHGYRKRREHFRKYRSNPAYIIGCYFRDFVDEKLLLTLLHKSRVYPSIRWLLPDIFSLVSTKSITNEVLKSCIEYPGKFRQTLLIQLGHMWLTTDQLEKLNEKLVTPEAFYKLFWIYMRDEKYSPDNFRTFLLKNERFLEELNRCRGILDEDDRAISKEKLLIVDGVIKRD